MNPLINECFPIEPSDIQIVRKLYDKSDSDVKDMVNQLKIWLKKQPHIPDEHEDNRLDRFLLKNKFRIEVTKKKLENYYTLRGMYKDISQGFDPILSKFTDAMKVFNMAPMPVLTPKMERVFVFKINKEQNHLFNYKDCMMLLFAGLELILSHDYSVADYAIIDLDGFSMNNFKTIEVGVMLKVVTLHQEAYSGRLSSISFVNGPGIVDLIIKLIKLVVKPKLFSVIRAHKNIESLQDSVPKECLPEEYGGLNKNIEYYKDNLYRLIVEERDYILHHASLVSDESKRIGKSPYAQENYGIEGSFRKINLD